MMKREISIFVMVLLLLPLVSAGLVEDFMGIELPAEQEYHDDLAGLYPCGETVNVDLEDVSDTPPFIDALSCFSDGYHVVSVHQPSNDQYYTLTKSGGELERVQKGICNTDYDLYEISIDTEHLRYVIEDGSTEEVVSEGIKILRSIEGLTLTQKFHLLKVAIKTGISQALDKPY